MTNTFTNNGRNILLNRMYKTIPDYTAPSKFKVGILSSASTVTDNDLTNAVPILPSNVVDDCDVITGWTANLTNTISLNILSFKEGVGALNLTKVDTTVVGVNGLKTTTSQDFTSKDFWGFVYISTALYALLEATTAALDMRFGSDASNYYQYTRTKAQLVPGWNTIKFNSTTATTVLSPVITACDYTYVGFNTAAIGTTTIDGDFIFDDLVLANTASYTKIFVSGYPTFNEPTNEATIRCYLSSVESIGYLIDSFGLFNTDTSIKMSEKDTFTGESKSQTDEFALIKVVRVL